MTLQVYLAGFTGATTEDARKDFLRLDILIRELKSYQEFLGMKNEDKIQELLELPRKSMFLDSGAFSAATQGKTINIDEYMAFIKKWEKYIDIYANLDVAPYGGLSPEITAKGTADNQKIMEDAGFAPLPVYHVDEDRKILQGMIEKYDYIALGGAVGTSVGAMIQSLDEVWGDWLVDSDGMPKVKVHGFAITSLPLMLRYPWFSVDSTTWVLTGRYGAVLVPMNGKTHRIVLSNKSPRVADKGQHFWTMSPAEQETLREYFAKYGYTAEDLAENYKLRDELNIIYYTELEKNWVTRPFKTKRKKFILDFGE